MASNYETPADVGSHTGTARHSHGYTDFATHSHEELYSMLFASDPGTVREAAAAWLSTGRMLADQAAAAQAPAGRVFPDVARASGR